MTSSQSDRLRVFAESMRVVSEELKLQVQHQRGVGMPPPDPDDQAVVSMVLAQLAQISVLGEEVMSRVRRVRTSLARAAQQLEQDERALSQALVQPVYELREIMHAVYGGRLG